METGNSGAAGTTISNRLAENLRVNKRMTRPDSLGNRGRLMDQPRRILVIDDEERNRDVLAAQLEALGYDAVLACNGFDGLAKLTESIDLVLLDVMMPGIKGFEVAQRIRSHPEYYDLPIIMVTVLDGREDRLLAAEAGANDFITKPIDRVELRVRIASLLKMREAQDSIKRHREELQILVEMRTAELRASEELCRTLYEESKKREELYRSILTSSADAIAIHDRLGRVTYLSPSFTRTFGWTQKELEGREIPYVPDYEHEPFLNNVRHHVHVQLPVSGLETKRFTKDGRVLDVSISASCFSDHEGNQAGVLVILRDITRRKRVEEALRESEERFKAVFETAQDCIFIKKPDLTYTHVNPAFLSVIGSQESSIIGETDDRIFSPDEVSYVKDVESRVLRGQTIGAAHSLTVLGQKKTLDCVRVPLRDSSNRIVGICGICREVAEQSLLTFKRRQIPSEFQSEAMRAAMEHALLVAKTDAIVLLLGESGSGKDYLARYLHDHSHRAGGSFFAINCAALAPELAESELFGHEAGAFTGSRGRKKGLLELAEGGTLLLNEIGELSLYLQAKLLTFLDTQTFTRVGGEQSISVNARILAATNRDLHSEVEAGNFRADLYYRLNVFSLSVPALRDRVEDLPLLAEGLLGKLSAKLGRQDVPILDGSALEAMSRYRWPGNVRELKNILERALILGKSSHITAVDLGIVPEAHLPLSGSPLISFCVSISEACSMNDALQHAKRVAIEDALDRSAGNVSAAARLLGISRDALRHHMKHVGLDRS